MLRSFYDNHILSWAKNFFFLCEFDKQWDFFAKIFTKKITLSVAVNRML